MQLLHHEINVEPGEKPIQDLRKSGAVGFGRAVLRLENKSRLINAYRVSVNCEDIRWNQDWCKLDALDAPTGEQVGAAGYRPDEIGLHREYVKVFVLAGSTRDVAIDIEVPLNPSARAGVYKLQIVVDVSITDLSGATREEQRQVKDATVIIRPYYDWTLQVTPKERKVGCFKRRERFEVQVENRGNDWLYCDFSVSELEAVQIKCEADRIAVPPPNGSGKTVRQIPMQVFHPKRIWRGGRQQYQLQVTAVRVNAPSVAPLSERAVAGDADANFRAAVLARDTRDNPTRVLTIPKLIFGPVIPATLTDFFRSLIASGRSLLFFVIGLILAAHIAVFVWGQIARTAFRVDPTGSWKPHEDLLVRGNYLTSALVDVLDGDSKEKTLLFSARTKPLQHGEKDAMALGWEDQLSDHSHVILRAHFVPHFFDILTGVMPTQDHQPVVEIVGGGRQETGYMLLTAPPENEPYSIPVHGIPAEDFPLYVEIGGTRLVAVTQSQIQNGSIVIPSPGPNQPIRILDRHKNPLSKIAADLPPSAAPSATGNDSGQGLITTPLGQGGGHESDSSGGGGAGGGETGAKIPAGYDHVLAAIQAEVDQNSKSARSEYQAAIAASGGDPNDQALVAYAQAALGDLAKAQAALNGAGGADAALMGAAEARISELRKDVPGVREHFGSVEASQSPMFLPLIADAAFEVRQGNKRNARQALTGTQGHEVSQAEQVAISKLQELAMEAR
jgi:hypothetical protein